MTKGSVVWGMPAVGVVMVVSILVLRVVATEAVVLAMEAVVVAMEAVVVAMEATAVTVSTAVKQAKELPPVLTASRKNRSRQ